MTFFYLTCSNTLLCFWQEGNLRSCKYSSVYLGLLLWPAPVGGIGWSWRGLLSAAGGNVDILLWMLLRLDELLWPCCTLSLTLVHLTMWKVGSGSQCSKNLTQPQRVFLQEFFCSFKASQRRVWESCWAPVPWGEEGKDHPYGSTVSEGQMSVAGLKLQRRGTVVVWVV